MKTLQEPFEGENQGKEWHTLIYGMYKTKQEAAEAYQQLPTSLKFDKPWIKGVNSVIEDIAYNETMQYWLDLPNNSPRSVNKM